MRSPFDCLELQSPFFKAASAAAPPDTTAPTISASSFTDSTDTLNVTVDEGGTLYWVLDASATAPSAAQVKAGNDQGGAAADASGSFAVSTGANSASADVSGVSSGSYYIYVMVEDASGNQSAVDSTAVTIDNTAPTVTSYSPADNAMDVAVDATLSIVFSESMDTSASTTVTLKNVGGATIETFDSSTDGTWSTTTNANDTWTVTPASSFTNSASLAVQYSGFKDANGNSAAAVANDTTWNFDVVAAAAGVQTATFDSSDWVDLTSDLVNAGEAEFVIAFRVTNKFTDGGAGDTFIGNNGEGTGGTYVSIRDSQGDAIYVRYEDTTGTNQGGGGDTVVGDLAIDASASVFVRCTSGSQELVVNGTSSLTSANTYTDIKVPRYINSSDAAGTGAVAMQITGFAICVASGCADASTGLTYSDFFDGSDQPIDAAFSGSAVSGFAIDRAFDTVASWNAYAGTTGTVV